MTLSAGWEPRLRASTVDALVVIGVFLGVGYLVPPFRWAGVPIKPAAMYLPLLFLEPLLIAAVGATPGQAWAQIRVRGAHGGPAPGFFLLVLRYWLKLLLAGASVVLLFFHPRGLAVHDLLTRSRVLPRDPSVPVARPPPRELSLPDGGVAVFPSLGRRLAAFAAWLVAAVLVVSTAAGLVALVVEEALPASERKDAVRVVEALMVLVLALLSVVLARSGAQGRLPGARRRGLSPESLQSGLSPRGLAERALSR